MSLLFSMFEAMEICSLIRVSTACGKTGKEIFDEVCEVFGESSMTIQQVRNWRCDFLNSCTQLSDKPHSGRPSDSVHASENVQQVRNLLEEDRRMSIPEICLQLQSPDCSRSSVWRIIHDVLQFCKLASRWVPRLLTDDHKKNRMAAALKFLMQYSCEGVSMLDQIVMKPGFIIQRQNQKKAGKLGVNLVRKVRKKRRFKTQLEKLWQWFSGITRAFFSRSMFPKVLS